MSIQSLDNEQASSRAQAHHRLLTLVLQSVHGLRFGSVEIVVHEGRIVQVERREKIRCDQVDRSPTG